MPTLKVKVRFLSYLADILGIKESVIEIPGGTTLGEALEIIKNLWPEIRKIDREGEGPIITLLNGFTAKLD
ncbi:MAG: hypothetical protein DRJ26_04160, partial [Candidatus Methanomethylicota archaeon]